LCEFALTVELLLGTLSFGGRSVLAMDDKFIQEALAKVARNARAEIDRDIDLLYRQVVS
jgi:hypothetical protein